MTSHDTRRHAREDGVALVLVVSVLAVVSVMVTHMVVVSRVSSVEAKVLADRHRLRHAAESAAEHAFWMYLCDRKRFPAAHRDLLSPSVPAPERGEQEAWLANGRVHAVERIDDIEVSARITDLNSGYSLAGKTPHKNIGKEFQDLEENEELRAFLDRLADYVDSDGATRLDGMEQPEYEALGTPSLPRNAPLEFREEILWIPGFVQAFRGGEASSATGEGLFRMFQMVPPPGKSIPAGGKPSILAASPALIRMTVDAGLGQAQQIIDAIERANEQNLPLAEILSPDLVAAVRRHFSTGESGVVSVSAEASSAGGTRRTYRIVRNCRGRLGATYKSFHTVDTWETVVW